MNKIRESQDNSNKYENLGHDKDKLCISGEKTDGQPPQKNNKGGSSCTKINYGLIKNLNIKMSILKILRVEKAFQRMVERLKNNNNKN